MNYSEHFQSDSQLVSSPAKVAGLGVTASLDELITRFGGLSFRMGLYRIVKADDTIEWLGRVSSAFPEFKNRISCFGYDWLGRVFAIDSNRLIKNEPGVIMFEPGTGEALEIPFTAQSFHDEGLLKFGESALAISFYKHWSETGGAAPNYTQCVGYNLPLFLGGQDIVENLAISDIDVYWHIMGQLIQKTRGLPAGTRVRPKII